MPLRPSTDRTRGASILELAFIAPLMILIVMAVIDLALAYRMQIRLENAAREGAAHAQLHPADVDCDGDGDIVGRIADEQDGVDALEGYEVVVVADPGGADTVVQGCDAVTVVRGTRLRVEVRAQHRIMTPLVAQVVGSSVPVTGSAEVEVQA